MTLEEALEYLNLPVNSRPYLVRKRYLELKRDYLKAIYNAPSEHFGSLYRENLQKIEEAYRLLAGTPEEVNDRNSDILKTIKQIQQVVDTFLKDKGTLDAKSREQLKEYIRQIDQLKDSLKNEGLQKPPGKHKPSTKREMNPLSSIISKASSNKPSPRGSASQEAYRSEFPDTTLTDQQEENEGENIINRTRPGKTKNSETNTIPDKRPLPTHYSRENMNLSVPGILRNWVNKIIEIPYVGTSRKHLYDQFLMGVILIIAILGILGAVYVIFPLFFSN